MKNINKFLSMVKNIILSYSEEYKNKMNNSNQEETTTYNFDEQLERINNLLEVLKNRKNSMDLKKQDIIEKIKTSDIFIDDENVHIARLEFYNDNFMSYILFIFFVSGMSMFITVAGLIFVVFSFIPMIFLGINLKKINKIELKIKKCKKDKEDLEKELSFLEGNLDKINNLIFSSNKLVKEIKGIENTICLDGENLDKKIYERIQQIEHISYELKDDYEDDMEESRTLLK